MESAVSGLLAGMNAARRLEGKAPVILPETTMSGALSRHVAQSESKDFQPMGANFGIFPPIEPHIRDKRARYAAFAQRAARSYGMPQRKRSGPAAGGEKGKCNENGKTEDHCGWLRRRQRPCGNPRRLPHGGGRAQRADHFDRQRGEASGHGAGKSSGYFGFRDHRLPGCDHHGGRGDRYHAREKGELDGGRPAGARGGPGRRFLLRRKQRRARCRRDADRQAHQRD